MPAQAGIHCFCFSTTEVGSRLCGNDEYRDFFKIVLKICICRFYEIALTRFMQEGSINDKKRKRIS